MPGPQTARGRQVKGWMGEAAVKALIGLEPDAPTICLDLSPSMMGTDLAVLKQVGFGAHPGAGGVLRWVLDRMVEVKTTQWRLLPSPVRQKVAASAVRWAAMEIEHEVWAPDHSMVWEVRRVDRQGDGRVRTLGTPRSTGFKFEVGRKRAPGTPPLTASGGGAVQ